MHIHREFCCDLLIACLLSVITGCFGAAAPAPDFVSVTKTGGRNEPQSVTVRQAELGEQKLLWKFLEQSRSHLSYLQFEESSSPPLEVYNGKELTKLREIEAFQSPGWIASIMGRAIAIKDVRIADIYLDFSKNPLHKSDLNSLTRAHSFDSVSIQGGIRVGEGVVFEDLAGVMSLPASSIYITGYRVQLLNEVELPANAALKKLYFIAMLPSRTLEHSLSKVRLRTLRWVRPFASDHVDEDLGPLESIGDVTDLRELELGVFAFTLRVSDPPRALELSPGFTRNLANAHNLEQVTLSYVTTNTDLWDCLSKLPNLKILVLHGVSLTEDEFRRLFSSNSLVTINAYQTGLNFTGEFGEEVRERFLLLND